MSDRDRVEQLRALLVRLERMPATAERDWMLREVRARAVDVETGEQPAAMRALSEDGAEAEIAGALEVSRSEAGETVPPRRPKRTPAPSRSVARAARSAPSPRLATPAPPSSPAPRRPPAHESVVDLLEQDGVICLDDEPAVADGSSRPWSVGLRD